MQFFVVRIFPMTIKFCEFLAWENQEYQVEVKFSKNLTNI